MLLFKLLEATSSDGPLPESKSPFALGLRRFLTMIDALRADGEKAT